MVRKNDIVLFVLCGIFMYMILTMTGCSTNPEFRGSSDDYKYTDCIVKNMQDQTIDNLYEFCRKKYEETHR